MNRPELLQATPILAYTHPSIQALIVQRGWKALAERERIGAIYAFVRDEIAFGYNRSDDLPASLVLADGIGQCNTKASLLMALFRACGVPCRFHGFTIDKALQKDAITGIAYLLAPRNIVHSWVEVSFEGRWVNLEGFILDKAYLSGSNAGLLIIAGRSAATASPRSIFRTRRWNGRALTRTSKRMVSMSISASTPVPTPSTPGAA